jgi:hypothetical protein
MYDISHPLVSSCRVRKDCAITSNSVRPSTVAAIVLQVQVQTRSGERRLPSVIVSGLGSRSREVIVGA